MIPYAIDREIESARGTVGTTIEGGRLPGALTRRRAVDFCRVAGAL